MKQIDFVLKGLNFAIHKKHLLCSLMSVAPTKEVKSAFIMPSNKTNFALLFVDMSGIIPEDDEEQEMYDDVGNIGEPIDEDIYEELPGLTTCYITTITSIMLENGNKVRGSCLI